MINIGANIGCFSILASRAVGPRGRVIAIKPPDMETYRQLVRNIQLNALVNIVPLRLAIAGEEGTATSQLDRQALFSFIFSSVDGRAVHGTDQDVRMTTLETVMQEQEVSRCDYLKLDCEGADSGTLGGTPRPKRRVVALDDRYQVAGQRPFGRSGAMDCPSFAARLYSSRCGGRPRLRTRSARRPRSLSLRTLFRPRSGRSQRAQACAFAAPGPTPVARATLPCRAVGSPAPRASGARWRPLPAGPEAAGADDRLVSGAARVVARCIHPSSSRCLRSRWFVAAPPAPPRGRGAHPGG